ncbi:tyrosine-type recombinase/integrase [Orenia marismortui]|uniref:tyrosine-type recombinase/integrase n=1 Tax=Orenia marismortui TaxID=46469 RepID=UPI0003779B55|nr:tyrosine-type recombinase/integrase [Orenia marismortui]
MMNEIINNNNQLADGFNPEQTIDEFLRSQDVKESTKKGYRRQLRPFFRWLETIDKNNALQREDILEYKLYLKKEGKSASTINAYLTVVRKFFKWLSSKNHNINNIAEDIKNVKTSQEHKKSALIDSQVKELLDSIDITKITGKRDYAMIKTMLFLGLRTIEVSRLKIKDIEPYMGQMSISIHGKGREEKDQRMFIHEDLMKSIHDYLKAREEDDNEEDYSEDDYIFISHATNRNSKQLTTRSIRRIVKKLLKGIGLNTRKYSAHSLRHTAITKADEISNNPRFTQNFARHARFDTTTRYIAERNKLENAVELKIHY